MFQSLFRRAEVAIEHTVGHIATRALIAVPFLIAAGFGTAALSLRLNREFGPETVRREALRAAAAGRGGNPVRILLEAAHGLSNRCSINRGEWLPTCKACSWRRVRALPCCRRTPRIG